MITNQEKKRIDKARHAACSNAYHLKYILRLEKRILELKQQVKNLQNGYGPIRELP